MHTAFPKLHAAREKRKIKALIERASHLDKHPRPSLARTKGVTDREIKKHNSEDKKQ